MPLLKPCYRFNRLTDIPISFFTERQIEGLVLDVDNTLTTHDNPRPAEGVLNWLAATRECGISMIILSNNSPERVAPFAHILGLDFEADGKKPMPGGVLRACHHMDVSPKRAALIGDQIFTDILGGNLAGLLTLLVDPIEPEAGWFFRLKRRCERLVLGGCTPGKEM
jgi:HAD superfamily phosphatase (TIGR01668 family)